MRPTPPISARDLIAENLRTIRGMRTQESLARTAFAYGIDWTRATIAAIETKRQDLVLTAHQWLILPTVLGRPLPDLLDNHGHAVVDGGFFWTAEAWQEVMIEGKPMGQMGRPGITETEIRVNTKVGYKLHVNPEEVFDWALELWGRTLPEERDDRLAKRPGTGSPAVRAGHITRALEAELTAHGKTKRRRRKR